MDAAAEAWRSATLDRLSNGRALINVVSGGDPQENRGDGLFWSHGERYRAAEEFLNVYKRILAGETVTYAGEYIKARAKADRNELLYAIVDQAVRKVGTKAPTTATK